MTSYGVDIQIDLGYDPVSKKSPIMIYFLVALNSSKQLCPPSIELNRIRYTVFIVRCDALLNLSKCMYVCYMYFFFFNELRKFTISDFPQQTHLGYTLIKLFFPYFFCAGCTSSGHWLKNNVKVWIDQRVKKKK